MKKTLYIIAATMSVLMAGCAKELTDESKSSEETGFAEGEKATFCFTPNFGECQGPETKALALMPDVKNIYFAVFDAEGFKLAEYAEAVPNTFADKNAPNKFSYSVELTVTDQPRIIHIIANAPESLTFGSEAEVIGSLCTYLDAQETKEGVPDQYNRQDAYWERIELEDGVWPEPDPDTKDTDHQYTTKYNNYMKVVNILAQARLTRNFTQMTVSNYDTDDFRITGFWLTNVPDRGSIAPYNRNTGAFQSGYGDYEDIDSMRDPYDGNYQGFFPSSAQIVSINGTDGWQDSPVDRDSDLGLQMIEIDTTKAAQKAGAHSFCYEREVPKTNPLYVIVAGKYDATANKPATFDWESVDETYYKIDLKDGHDTYFPILRNFNYKVNIKDVKRAGAATVEGALSAAPSGDIDSSLDMLGLTNISDGVSQIFVSETDVVLVGNNAVQLRYKYIPNLSSPTTTANDTKEQWEANNSKTIDVAGTDASGNHPDYVTIEHSAGTSGAVFVTDGISVAATNETGGNGYRVITLTPTTPLSYILSETITITGHHWDGAKWVTLSRVVNYKLREKISMTVSCSPTKVEDVQGQNINVVIGLEAGLPSSIFSLDMDIEAKGLSITANNKVSGNDLPVTTGASTIPSNTKPAYYFTRTITWTEYQNAPVVDGYKYFTSYFKTNKVLSTDQIYISNKYFNQANTTYKTYTAKTFKNLAYSDTEGEVNTPLTFTFDMSKTPSDGKVIVGMKGVEKKSTTLTYLSSDSDGYELYELPVTGTSGSFSITPYYIGVATIKLDADEFRTESKDINVYYPGSEAYTIEVNSINLYRANTGLTVPNGTTISVYFSDPKSGNPHPITTFNANSNSRNAGFSITTLPGSTLYFAFEYNGDKYYASTTIENLDNAENTTSGRYSLIFQTTPPKYIIEAGSLNIYKGTGSTGIGNNKTISVYAENPTVGSPSPIKTFTTDSNSRNKEFTLPADSGISTLWFHYTDGINDFYGSSSLSNVNNATTSGRANINISSSSPTYTLEAGSITVQRNGSNWGNATIHYYFADPKSGSPEDIGSFTTGNSGTYQYSNSSSISIQCPTGTTIYFRATRNTTNYYGSATIDDLDDATSSHKITLNLKQ